MVRSALCALALSLFASAFSHHGGDNGDEKQSLAWSVDRGRTWTLYANNRVQR